MSRRSIALVAPLLLLGSSVARAQQQPASRPATPASAPTASSSSVPGMPPLPGDEVRGPRALWVWTGLSVTAGLMAAGVVAGQMTHSRAEEYNDPKTSVERRRDLKDSGETLRTASIVAFSLAGAAALSTALYYYLGYRRDLRCPGRTRLSAAPTRGGGAFAVVGEF